MKSKKTLVLLILVLLTGGFLRFYNLGRESFWLDESATALAMKYRGPYENLKNIYKTGQILPELYVNNPDLPHGNQDLPVYYFLLANWVKIFGLSEITLRSFSALFGLLSILIVFFIAKEIFNKNVALLSSLISSMSVALIASSQEARNYSFYLFISLLSVYFLIKFLNTDKNNFLAMFIAATIIGAYTHFIFILLVFFEAVFIYWQELSSIAGLGKFRLSKLGASFFIVILSYLPLLARVLNQTLSTIEYIAKPNLLNSLQMLATFNAWIYTSEQMKRIKGALVSKNFIGMPLSDYMLIFSILLLSIILTVFALKSLFIILKKRKRNEMFLVMLVVVPLLASLITSYIHPSISTFGGFGSINFIIYVIPAYFIMASHGILCIKRKHAKILILLIIILSITPMISYHSNVRKMQFREAALFLKGKIESNDVIFFNIRTGITPFTYYYGETNRTYPLANLSRATELSKDKKSIWLVSTLTKYSDRNSAIKKYFDSRYKLAEKKEFFDLTAYHYVQ